MSKKAKLITASITAIIVVIVIASIAYFNGDNGDEFVGTWMEDAKTYFAIKKQNNGYELAVMSGNTVESTLKGKYDQSKEVMTFDDEECKWTYEFKIDSKTGNLMRRLHYKSPEGYSKTYSLRKVSSDEWE